MGFEELNLHPDIMKAIKNLGFVEPTPIQSRCIPEIKLGKDVVGQSLTGSGKTAAFGLPLLEKVYIGRGVQALILTPTRELASQIKEDMIRYSAYLPLQIIAVYGGVSMQPQIDGLRRAEIVVATPGRILDHIRHNTINLKKVSFLVLDEADKMFEMGFIDDVRDIIRSLPTERQTLLFSATMSSEIHSLVRSYLKNPVNIKEQLHVNKDLLKQYYYDIDSHDKFSLLVHLLKNKTSGLAIVFCGTRQEVDVLTRNLKMQKIQAMAVHGGLSQNKRTQAVNSIKHDETDVLVATDVAARGLHIENISHIYNYDSAKNSCEYTHRIGRTARAGKYGEAVTLLTERDHENFREVMSDSTLQINKEQVPSFERVRFMCEMRSRFGGGRRFGSYGRSNSGFAQRRGQNRGPRHAY